MKFISLIIAGFFSWMCYNQLNDPDKIIWIAVYGATAVCSLLNIFYRPGKKFLILPVVIAGAALVGCLLLLRDYPLLYEGGGLFNVFSPEYGEEKREFLGLVLVIVASLYEMAHTYLRSSREE